MVNLNGLNITPKIAKEKALKIRLLLTDNDGVLTDTGVYYSSDGEVMKRFSIRDGMGVERLRTICNIDSGIITGELSGSVEKRAEKLKMKIVYLGSKDKLKTLDEIVRVHGYSKDEIAYIGDDYNDIDIIKEVGLSAAPGDALSFIKKNVDFICENKGGNGAFREFAELIIFFQTI
ncbi:MAG: HAD-IIIA family hydrolase [Ignavibacteriaceae bacterium]|nr:HAD-IIIA family hydrolase [Ignavibacteriaceae bacterium]